MSDHVREGLFSSPEVGDPEPDEQGDDTQTHEKPGHVQMTFSAQHAPAKTIDDPDDWVE
jgi:hypothetical protein